MTRFDIYPAIDLRHGQVVRLQHGDPAQQTVFSADPLAVAARWVDGGARWLHVVNLDGAFAEEGNTSWTILESLARLPIRLQYGGGLRTMADIEMALSAGVSRVVLGTAALENPPLVSDAIGRFGPSGIAVGIDARDGRVRTRGWMHATDATPVDLAKEMAGRGVRTIIYTDISRDGVLSGVNMAATHFLARETGLEVIASGGVNSLDEVVQLRSLAASGVVGVIIGRALYEGQVDLAEAVALADED